MSVLIADNDLQVCSLLAEVLQRAGLGVSFAHDGIQARAQARQRGLRVLVCDLDMPGANGLEVLESLVDLERPPLAVVISGYLDPQIEARLRRLPFVRSVLSKPFDLMRFAGIVKQLDRLGNPLPTREQAGPSQAAGAASGAAIRPDGDRKNEPRHA